MILFRDKTPTQTHRSMTPSIYTQDKLRDDVNHLKKAVRRRLAAHQTPKGMGKPTFTDWYLVVRNNSTHIQIDWFCGNLNGTESIAL